MNQPADKPKVDRRILRTKQALREALFQLLQQKEYDEITVEEITDLANIGRATFYLHYKDKEDLLLEEISNRVDSRAKMIYDLSQAKWLPPFENRDELRIALEEKGVFGPIRYLFQHIYDNSEFYSILLKNSNSGKISERIRTIIIEGVSNFLNNMIANDKLELTKDIPIDVIAAYFSGALLSSISMWMDQGMKYTPQEMSDHFYQLFVNGSKIYIKLNRPQQ